MSQQPVVDLSDLEQDQSFLGTGNEYIEQEGSFGDETDFPIPLEHPGEMYFRTTPFVEIKPCSYVKFRSEVAQHDPLRVADEWNAAMSFFKSSNKNSPKNAMLRKIPPKFKKLSKGNVALYAKVIMSGEGVDANANSGGEVDSEAKSTNSSSRQLSDVDFTSVEMMKAEFAQNFANYKGLSLILTSGVDFDQALFQFVMSFNRQSRLHSFVIGPEDFARILPLFDDIDSEQLAQLVKQLDSNTDDIPVEDWKIKAINHYRTPYTVQEVIFNGWNQSFALEGTKPVGYEAFIKMVFDFMNDVLETYKEFGEELVGDEIKLPRGLPERTYLGLWGIFFRVLSKNCKLVKLSEGEISSTASAIRRNAGRTRDDRQNGGHKLDAIFYVTRASDAEFGAVEGGKKNENSYGTKYLSDGEKLSKALKDMFDNICTKAVSNRSDVTSLKSTLEVYGFLVSGEKLEFLTLRYFGGRFYMLQKISEHFLPTHLHMDTFAKIRNLLNEFLLIRKRMEESAQSITSYVDGDKGSYKKQNKQEFEQYPFPQTLTTPPASPRSKKAKLFSQ
ncbi:hypothetical protein BGX27_003144 [Mortierella sp. AM989]|nr:hypothetical protein BGX27_003144 [Mortierella sp. AM989]